MGKSEELYFKTRGLVAAEFDAAFYRESYPASRTWPDPVDHFLARGWSQGCDPSPDFSVFNYLLRNDDVLRRHLNPFVHYLLSGRDNGRQCHPSTNDYAIYLPWEPEVADLLPMWFDEPYFIEHNPELRDAPNALAQFLVIGWTEGRDPCADFSIHKYLWKYSDVMLSGENPLIHYLRVGQQEGREAVAAEGSRTKVTRHLSDGEWLDRVKAEFDAEFYSRTYASVKSPDPFRHYLTTGWLEGRDPNEKFSVRQYLDAHRDVRDTGQEPLNHYVRFGTLEGRRIFPSEATPEDETFASPVERDNGDELLRAEFDQDYYSRNYPELSSIEDCFQHYMDFGWKESKNPSDNFETDYYLRNEGDIRQAGINPYRHFVLHGRREGRRGVQRMPKRVSQQTFPKVTVIIPNYNHARFLPARLQSVVDQNYPNLELLLLDDCSSDNSREVLSDFAATYKGDCQIVFNEANSGNVFAQWQRGLSMATGELIWICESDDTCDAEFLNEIVYLFQDPSLKLAFGGIEFINQANDLIDGMAYLRESAAPGIWNDVKLMPASWWFSGPLAVRNLIANVGGSVFRKPSLSQDVWETLRTFKVAGDWYLYLVIAGGGQIAYAPNAKAYFRQHTQNTSVTAFQKVSFYEELGRFHTILRQRWAVSNKMTTAFYCNLLETFESSSLAKTMEIAEIVSLDQLLRVKKTSVHAAVSFLNFNIGGGEIFPIELLNVLHDRGVIVSAVVQSDQSDNLFVRGWLHPDIPVYVADKIALTGPELAAAAGFDIIHSHNIWAEFFFVANGPLKNVKYVSTLHGSYEVSHIQANQVSVFFDHVTWAYLADRNLEKFRDFGFDTSAFRLIPNGMARRLSPQPVSRSSLGISAGSFVFLFAARSHPQKGWLQAAQAFDMLCNQEAGRDITLLMAGAGSEPERVSERFAHNPAIKMIGFRSDVDDLLEISDVLLLPTRFAGESMPLTLIQSILAEVPFISTDVGQIRDMVESSFGPVGVVIEPFENDELFASSLAAAMHQALAGELTPDVRAFQELQTAFSIETCADSYLKLYGLQPSSAPGPSQIPAPEFRSKAARGFMAAVNGSKVDKVDHR